jgi:hypothetical protein
VLHTTTSEQRVANLRAYSSQGRASWRYAFSGEAGTSVGAVALARNGDVLVAARGAKDSPFQGLGYGDAVWYVAALAP